MATLLNLQASGHPFLGSFKEKTWSGGPALRGLVGRTPLYHENQEESSWKSSIPDSNHFEKRSRLETAPQPSTKTLSEAVTFRIVERSLNFRIDTRAVRHTRILADSNESICDGTRWVTLRRRLWVIFESLLYTIDQQYRNCNIRQKIKPAPP